MEVVGLNNFKANIRKISSCTDSKEFEIVEGFDLEASWVLVEDSKEESALLNTITYNKRFPTSKEALTALSNMLLELIV